jgi:dTDP-4-amino-4,6-dideoxygalactose transaminase
VRLPLVCDRPLSDEDVEAAVVVLRSGRVTQGEKVAELERVFAEAHGYTADRAVFCNSGSSANLLAVSALDLKPGDEVIVPAVTWPTQVWPIVQCGGVPVFHDANPETLGTADWTRDVKAMFFALHCLGNATMIVLPESLEDCCEALGATIDGKPVGTFGRFGTFSFYMSHHVTTIEGGMVLCRRARDADRLRVMRNHGMSRHLSAQARQGVERAHPDIDPRFLFLEPGYNLRGTDVAAAIGLAQWPKREAWALKRREIAAFWTASLDASVFAPVTWAPGAVPFAFPLVLRRGSKTPLATHLESAGIETRPILAGNLARQPAMRKVKHRIVGPLTGADILHDRGLYVGLSPHLTDAQIEYLRETLNDYCQSA